MPRSTSSTSILARIFAPVGKVLSHTIRCLRHYERNICHNEVSRCTRILTWTQSPSPTFSLGASTLMPYSLIVRSACASLAVSSLSSIQGESSRRIGHAGSLALGHVASQVLGQLANTLAQRGLRAGHQPLQPVRLAPQPEAESVLKPSPTQWYRAAPGSFYRRTVRGSGQ